MGWRGPGSGLALSDRVDTNTDLFRTRVGKSKAFLKSLILLVSCAQKIVLRTLANLHDKMDSYTKSRMDSLCCMRVSHQVAHPSPSDADLPLAATKI